ncbi:pyridoxamine 5'-phosphate oxidase family protein [Oryzobacter terrae]|uniref:pyridoxamine 5'-phosphate oxidase family protein n=1 Tax=Oryzobacter terrae TaxID=1620385 RepID=UPI00366F73F8
MTDSTGEPGDVREIPTHECLALLRESPVGRLAVVVEGRPEIFPVNHVVDHGTVVLRTASGTKFSGSVGLPVAFEVDGYDAGTGEAWSVVVHGTGRSILRIEEVVDALQLTIVPWQGGPKPQMVRIVPDRITGRRFRVAGGFRRQGPDPAS